MLAAVVVCAVTLLACSDKKSPTSATSSRASHASIAPNASEPPAPPATLAPTAHTTTTWPPASTTTTTAPKTKTKPKPPPPPPSTVVCDRLSGAQLQAALGVAYNSASGTDSTCTYTGDDGSSVSLALKNVSGSPSDAVNGARSACDAGTDRTVAAGAAGFDCLAGGTPIAVTANDTTFFRLALFDFHGDTSHAQDGLGQLLSELA